MVRGYYCCKFTGKELLWTLKTYKTTLKMYNESRFMASFPPIRPIHRFYTDEEMIQNGPILTIPSAVTR